MLKVCADVPVGRVPTEVLITRFERDIGQGPLLWNAEYRRSEARQELFDRGPRAVAEIKKHIIGSEFLSDDVRKAWEKLCDEITAANPEYEFGLMALFDEEDA